jgi:hypothetical protein
MALEPDEAITVLSRSEALVLFPLVPKDAFEQVAGHADVKRPAAAGHPVNQVGALVHVVIAD